MEKDSIEKKSENVTSDLVKVITVSGFLKIIAQLIFFVSKDIFLYNWLDTSSAHDFTLLIGYMDLINSFIIITPWLLPKFYQEIKKNQIQSFTRKAIILFMSNFLIILIILIILTIFGFSFEISTASDIIFVILLVISALFFLLLRIFESAFYGLQKAKEIGIINIIVSLCFTVLILFVRILGSINFIVIAIIYIISNLISLIVSLIFFNKQIMKDKSFSNQIGKGEIERANNYTKNIIKFSFPIFVGQIFYYINFKLGSVIFANSPEELVVYYHISTSIVFAIISFIGLPINDGLYPFLAKGFADKDKNKIEFLFNLILPIIALVLGGILLISYSLSNIILGLLYPDYVNETLSLLFKFIALGGIFYCFNQFLGRILIANGKTQYTLWFSVISGIMSLIFLLFSMQKENILFAGYGFLFSSLISFVMHLYFTLKNIEIGLKESKFIQILLSIFIPIILNAVLNIFISNYIIVFIIIFGSFISLILIFKIISIMEFKTLLKTLYSSLKSIIKKSII